ncbi:MAG TPA: methyl-accepting chemotaxis protein [Steroidobacteraceae bacterium]|nr:methyl-accepting chemotaxis protein [Steroidobacteraceae bacterium]
MEPLLDADVDRDEPAAETAVRKPAGERRVRAIVWRIVALQVFALLAVFGLAYGAGAYSGGLSMLDFGALSFNAGVRLWAAALLTVVAVLALVWLGMRILQPLQQLVTYSHNLETPDFARPDLPASNDDFAAVAERMGEAADKLAIAAADQQRLAALDQRLREFAGEAGALSQGRLGIRFAATDGALGEAQLALNQSLDNIAKALDGARALCGSAGETAERSLSVAQQMGKTLVNQQSELAAATRSFDVIPPTTKQVADNSEAVVRSIQGAVTSAEQGRQQTMAANAEVLRLGGSLRSVADVLANLQQAAEHVTVMLRALSGVAERANLLALNAAIEASRSGQAGRSSWMLAEEFRDLAQQSNTAGAELAALMQGIQHDCEAALNAVEAGSQVTRETEAQTAQAARSVDSASASINEASARAEVIGIASARQADAARAVGASLQAGSDLQQLAALQSRQAMTVLEELLKLQAQLRTALDGMQARPAKPAQAAGSGTELNVPQSGGELREN